MADGVRETYREGRRDVIVALGDAKVFWAVVVVWLASSALTRNLEGWVGLGATLALAAVAVTVVLLFRRAQPPR